MKRMLNSSELLNGSDLHFIVPFLRNFCLIYFVENDYLEPTHTKIVYNENKPQNLVPLNYTLKKVNVLVIN